jgi:hypothetical protein
LAQRHEVDEGLFVEPAPANDEFLAEVSNMSDGSTEAAYAKLEEDGEHFEWRARARHRRCGLGGSDFSVATDHA